MSESASSIRAVFSPDQALRFLADIGAFNPIGSGVMYNTIAHLVGPYRIENFSAEAKVVTTNKGCVALAVDGHKPCGPNGYANAPKLGQAQNTALQHCYKYGGKDCVIRAFICDGKKS